MKKLILLFCFTATALYSQTQVREKLVPIELNSHSVIKADSLIDDFEKVTMPDPKETRLKILKQVSSTAYNCHIEGKGDFVKLIPGKCETEGLNQTSNSLQTISGLITISDFRDSNKNLASPEEVETFYFGDEESCTRCSNTSERLIDEVSELIIKKENELRLKEGVTKLRNMIIKNLVAMDLDEPLSEGDIKKVSCHKKFKKLITKGSCEENFLKALKDSDSFGVVEGSLDKRNLSNYLYNSVKNNMHSLYVEGKGTFDISYDGLHDRTHSSVKGYYGDSIAKFTNELSGLYKNGQLERICRGSNREVPVKLAEYQGILGRFIATKKMTSIDEICNEYFLSVEDGRELSIEKDIVLKSRENVSSEVDDLCDSSYDKVKNLVCDETRKMNPDNFSQKGITGEKAAFYQVAEDLKDDASKQLALKTIACMRHDDFIESRAKNSARALGADENSNYNVINAGFGHELDTELESVGDNGNTSSDEDYDYFSDYSLSEGTFVLNRSPGFNLGGETYSFGGGFGDGLGSIGDDSISDSTGASTYDFTSDQDISSGSTDSDTETSYLGQWSERFGQGTNTIAPSDPLEQSFASGFGANSYDVNSSAISRAYVPSALEDSMDSSDNNFISDDQEVQDLLNSQQLQKDKEIAQLKNEIDSLKEDKKKTLLEKAQADYEKLRLENEELKKIAALKKEAIATREPASVEEVSFNSTPSPFSSSSSSSQADESKSNKESYKSVTNFVSAPSNTSSLNNQATSEISSSGGSPSTYSANNYNSALTAILKTDSTSSPENLDSGVSNIISSMLKEGTVSTIYISRKEGIDTVVFEDQSREVELTKFSPRTQKLIKEYVAFSEKKKVEEKREVVLDLGELNKKESDLKMNLLKKALYSSMAELDPKWAKEAKNY